MSLFSSKMEAKVSYINEAGDYIDTGNHILDPMEVKYLEF